MKFEGKYLYNETMFKNCSFLIENRKIHNLEVETIPLASEFRNPKNNSEFEFDKFQSERPLTPKGYNYFIEYFAENNTTHKISIKLNFFQVFKLKWQLKKSFFHISKWSVIFNSLWGLITIIFLLLNYNLSNNKSKLIKRNETLTKKTDSLKEINSYLKENLKSLNTQFLSHKDSVAEIMKIKPTENPITIKKKKTVTNNGCN
jgi:hypothetical protein